uniref:Uncharacterized protein n=1 Tax=Vitis vinifera TaxID=29760 RepID=F6HT30_VITVI
MDTWLLEIVTLGKIKLQKMSPKWGNIMPHYFSWFVG